MVVLSGAVEELFVTMIDTGVFSKNGRTSIHPAITRGRT